MESDLTKEEIEKIESIVDKLNSDNNGIDFRLVLTKGTYYIFPQFEEVI